MKKINYLFFSLLLLVLASSCKKEDPNNPANLPEILECGAFNQDRTLTNDPNKPIDYIVDCLIDIGNAKIVIEPGTVIVFNAGTGIAVEGAGYLNAVGTASAPIIMKGELDQKGIWRGIYVNSSSPLNELTHVHIDHAGGDSFNSNGDLGAVVVWAEARLKMHNSRITNSGSNGINATYNSITLDLKDNIFEDNIRYPLFISQFNIPQMDVNSSHDGNGEDFIAVESSSAGGNNVTIQKLDVPYLFKSSSFNDFTYNVNVEIEAGTRIEFENQTHLRINENGSLKAVGTSTEPIIFTGTDNVPGSWAGIHMYFTTSPLNELNNVLIEYAGQGSDNVALYLWANPRIKVENSTFKDIEGCAIYHGASNASNFTSNNITFDNVGTQFCD